MTDVFELPPMPEDLRELFAAEKTGEEAPGAVRERVLLRLVGTLLLGEPRGHSHGVLPHRRSRVVGPARRVATSRLAQLAAIFLTGAAAGAGGYRVAQPAREMATPAPSCVDTAQTVAAAATRFDSEVHSPSTPAIPSSVASSPSVAPSSPPTAAPGPQLRRPFATTATTATALEQQGDDRLAAERNLVEIARTALSRGQAEGALDALERHAQQFPTGKLVEEREALLVQALVGAGEYERARERAARFNRRYPRSLFAPVVEQALGSIP